MILGRFSSLSGNYTGFSTNLDHLMNTRSTLSILSACAAAGGAMIAPAAADFVVGGPGMDSYSLTQTNDQVEVNMGEWYRYEVQGYYGRLNATAPIGSEVHSSGKFRQGNSYVEATISASAYVNGSQVGSALALASDRATATTDDLEVVSALPVIDEADVTLKFVLTSNVANPDGYLTIMGTGVQQPPKPVGEIFAPTYAETGTTPTVGWKVTKNMSSVTSGGSTSVPDVTIPEEGADDPGTETGGWSGTGKSNNGHGNNLDGVDISNPGKGQGGPNAMKDTEYDGIFDTRADAEADYMERFGVADAADIPEGAVFLNDDNGNWYVDDEAGGGGAYPSMD